MKVLIWVALLVASESRVLLGQRGARADDSYVVGQLRGVGEGGASLRDKSIYADSMMKRHSLSELQDSVSPIQTTNNNQNTNNNRPNKEPPGELVYSNNTGAIVQCGLAQELAKNIARSELALARKHDEYAQLRQLAQAIRADIQIHWQRDNGERIEPTLYSSAEDPAEPGQHQQRLLRLVRPDGTLVLEPFRASDFRPDVHASSYRCVASSQTRAGSLVSRDMQLKPVIVPTSPQIEVADELVIEGNSAHFRCQIPAFAQDYLSVVDWVEYPTETALSYQSTTLAAAHLLFRPRLQQPQLELAGLNRSQVRYLVSPKSGDLHIVGVDAAFNYRSYKCRCKNRLTGELVSSLNKGKLIVTESRSPLAPRVTLSNAPQQPVYLEGELGLLSCAAQAFPRAKISWFRRPQNEPSAEGQELVELTREDKYAQLGGLLLINRLHRNDSGSYLCQVNNSLGDDRVELELHVRAELRAKLSTSASVLELGKSLVLDCTVTGFPIHQVVFRHNQNIIKSISGSMQANHQLHHYSNRQQQQQQPGNYFVLDESSKSQSPLDKRDEWPPESAVEEGVTGEGSLSHVIVIVLEPEHAGAYQCFAQNQYESVESSAYIRVLDDPPKFKDTFKSQVLEQRQDVSLQCSARANPLPEITWSIDEQPVPESSRTRFGDFVTKDNLVISYVNISQTEVQDSGLYKCTADNRLAQISHQAQLSVLGPLQIKPMANVTVVASTTFRIRCPVAGFPVGDIQWAHNGRRLPANHRQHVYENGTLEVEHMEKSQLDEGEYVCSAHLPAGQAEQAPSGPVQPATGSLHVSIKVRPSIEPFTISRSLIEGQRATVTCTVSSGDLPISIVWYRNERLLVPNGGQPQVLQQELESHNESVIQLAGLRISHVSDYSSSLLFESLLAQHSGNYTCLARNEAGSVSHQAPMIVQVAPKWSIEPSDTNAIRGSSVRIDCMASGFPPPRIIWTKASSEPTNNNLSKEAKSQHLGSWRSIVSSPHLQVYENGSLSILDARDSDLGHYMCQANNGVGPGLSQVVKVTINVAAQFSSKHSVQYVVIGDQVQLRCQAKGDWPMRLFWFKNRSRLEPINQQDAPEARDNQLISSTIGSVLLVSSLKPLSTLSAQLPQIRRHLKGSVLDEVNALLASAGHDPKQEAGGLLMPKYSLASSEIALNKEFALIDKVRSSNSFEHQFIADKQTAPVVVQISSVLTISQTERQDTSTFKCLAANQFGLDERTIQLVVQEPPGRLEELSVLEVSSRTVILGWLAPHDGNSPINNYHVQYRALSGASELALSQLAPEALDSLNWFNHSLPAGGTTNETQTYTTTTSYYQYNDQKLVPGGSRALVKIAIGSLRPVTAYWFRVGADNKLGRGPMSRVVESVTMEEAPGAAPTKLKALAQSSSSILVSWQKLSDKEVFGSLHGYYVAYKPLNEPSSNQSNNKTYTPSDAQEAELQTMDQHLSANLNNNIYKTIQHDEKLNKFDALLTGLKRSTKYVISVQAFNARGTGPASEPVVAKTLDMDLPRQVKLYVKQTTNCSIKLEWRPMSQAALLHQQSPVNGGSQLKTFETKLSKSQVHLFPVALPLRSDSLEPARQSEGTDVVDYYTLYQAELTDRPHWQETRLPGHVASHTMDNLRCGARYQFYMMGVNRVGIGEQSDILDTKTSGELASAPDRQAAFDVVNATCYIVRLDHWQDNGCPITEFTVNFRPDSVRDYTQLAHFKLFESQASTSTDQNETNKPLRQASSSSKRYAGTSIDLWPSSSPTRTKRSSNADKDDSYVFSLDELPEDEGSFLDYSSDSNGDYIESSNASNSSLVQLPEEQSSQLMSLLKDSMLPTFDAAELGLSRLDRSVSLDSSTYSDHGAGRAPSDEALHRTVRMDSQLGQDWRRVRICNLAENTFYTIQVIALNSVGESESELRLLTSPEGLEYDQDFKRQVVAKLGADRLVQSVVVTDRFGYLSFNQWPVLLPISLTLILMTIIVVITLLLKRSHPAGSTSTTTTTTTMSSSNHCQNYINESHAGHHSGGFKGSSLGGAPSAITEATIGTDMMANSGASLDNYALTGPSLVDAFNNGSNFYQQNSNQSVFGDETAYGVVGLGLMSQSSNNETKQPSSSPATTGIGSSLNSSSTGGPSNPAHFNSSMFLRLDNGQQDHTTSRPRNVYLCTASASALKDETTAKSDKTIFYGMTHNPQQALYSHQPVQVRHFPQEDGPAVNNYLPSEQIFQESYSGNPAASQQLDMTDSSVENKQLDNCFLTIVEEVARTNDSLGRQQRSNSNQMTNKELLGRATGQIQCNQADCLNQQHSIQQNNNSNYAQLNQEARDEAQKFTSNNNTQAENGLMFDPVYATIRRTFPQAFRYLTLQQPNINLNANPQARASIQNNQTEICNQQPLGDQNAHDMALFNSNNLAALNLLTPMPNATTIIQQPQPTPNEAHQVFDFKDRCY